MKSLRQILWIYVGAFLLSFLFAPAGAKAAPLCEQVFEGKYLTQQSSVELEIAATDAVIELFDTLDGTLAPAMAKAPAEALPAELLATLREVAGPEADPLSVAWDLLSPSEKAQVITASAKARGQDFHKERKVPGLKYRENVKISFAEPTRFLGADYTPGTYEFRAHDIFPGTAIEFMGPTRMSENLGFELHVRSHLTAGENLLTTRALQKSLLGEMQNVHLHMVAPYPKKLAEPAPESMITRLLKLVRRKVESVPPTDYYNVDVYRAMEFSRRVMLYFDFRMIELGLGMTVVKDSAGTTINFSPLSPQAFLQFAHSLSQPGLGGAARSKTGTVGTRTKHFYDSDVWGLEVRFLSGRLNQAQTAQAISKLQGRMVSGEYFISREEAMARLGGPKAPILDALSELLYVDRFEEKMTAMNLTSEQAQAVRKAAAENDFVKMLVHDWSRDPMFAGKPERVQAIEEARKVALAQIFSRNSSTEAMRTFIRRSGLVFEMQKMLE